ncbi:hypothetical protein PC116_g29518 [Phytophthora cactorum]|uniref:Uncharacterized protein n=1 Tax=Phytophthora cactorum TaxID=29920 RepID=A0A8T1JD49_9STRA|nr:hypothetical protein Pcac1_g29451 [Phytophthora cactorum]KAG2872895.1 hypothetical protein PC114_g26131 [Phytophthora cactorum]KAG2879670.1 hypothetical protein PC117_g26715 [Phytophthora cactorum]KAG2960057.1 hypothetical protein PC119_g26516 [Phytophthora cactorum]KAG3126014.1 hypothetical protein C6341_g25542 [Phytophthora cactorum]
MRLHPTFYVGWLKLYTQPKPSNLDGSQRMTKRRKPASQARLHGRVEHGSHGQPGVDRTRGIFPLPLPPLRDARGSTRWIVERIVGYEPTKTNRDQARLRNRWRGFRPHRDTWGPRNVLMEDVPEMVRAYEAPNGVQA